MSDNTNLDPGTLKIQALTQRIAELTADYENKVADLRVAYTISQDELQKANNDVSPEDASLPAD